MIQMAYLADWREQAPWITDAQVEQDLLLSRVITEIFSDAVLAQQLAFRGGTALQKLFYPKSMRYSEDVDLVQIEAGPIGETINRLREHIDPWLGQPEWKQNAGRFTLDYRFSTEMLPITRLRIKIEINTREHFAVAGFQTLSFQLNSLWHSQTASVTTYKLEELLGTKLRALYQRKKGRDLFDLATTLENHPNLDLSLIIKCFQQYMAVTNTTVTRAEFEKNLHTKMQEQQFLKDIAPLLPISSRYAYNAEKAYAIIMQKLIALLPGERWKKLI